MCPPALLQERVQGTVVKVVGGFCFVHTGGRTVQCVLRGRVKRERRMETSPVVVGDHVTITLLPDGTGVIEEILPRASTLSKASPRNPKIRQVLAANVDQAVVVFAARAPDPSPAFIDRFLVLAEAEGLVPILCLNKVDLGIPEELAARYRAIGYQVVFTSARTGEGLDHLKAILRDRISILVGPSGVGKSSLLNAIQPGLGRRVGEISARAQKGRHTTTTAELLPLSSGGFVVDTPGVQVLEVLHIPRERLQDLFPEIRALRGSCTFPDCLHVAEPGCAVKRGVEEGKVHPERYASYLAILAELERAPQLFLKE
ncbi:MAG: ribosome small subunit-dependent GTPase A [Armatimonadota bacterium]|nr:ribosome small subunit-dependent GTPase A [Armatimonadota bacterium]